MKSKTTETGPFLLVVSLHPPGGNNFVHATLQQRYNIIGDKLALDNWNVHCKSFELFESLREDVSIHRTNLKYYGKSLKIRVAQYVLLIVI